MNIKVGRFGSHIVLMLTSLTLMIASQTIAYAKQNASKEAIVVSKLVKHVTWPKESEQSAFIIGVYKDKDKFDHFNQYFENKGIRNKDISVRLIQSYSEAKVANILYFSSSNNRKTHRLMSRFLAGSEVLVVTENSKELSKTMIDISYDKPRTKMNVRVVDKNISLANLSMPEFSFLITNNDDADNILPVSPTFAAKLAVDKRESNAIANKSRQQAELSAMQRKIAIQNATLIDLKKALRLSKKKAQDNASALKKNTNNLQIAKLLTLEKEKSLKAQNDIIIGLEKALKNHKTTLAISNDINQNSVKNSDVQDNETKLVELTNALQKQQQENSQAHQKISTLTAQNNRLSNLQLLCYFLLFITLFATMLALYLWKKSKSVAIVTPPAPIKDLTPLLEQRTAQLIKSENVAALGYVATDITYAIGLSLDELYEQFDDSHAAALKPIMHLLENFNHIAADQDETEQRNFDLVTYVQNMISLYDFEFSQSNIVYSYSGEKSLKINSVPSYIALVLINVINNSLKHGFDNNGDGKLTLKIENLEEMGVKISFSDNGIGMKQSVLDQVFSPFFTTQIARGYVGVGMSNAKEVIDKLGGNIIIQSKQGSGTTVVITLPNKA